MPALSQSPTSDLTAGDSTDMDVTAGVIDNLFKWYINDKTFAVEYERPTSLLAANGMTNWTDTDHVIELTEANTWIYFVIETTQGVPHPMHLHGMYTLCPLPTLLWGNSIAKKQQQPRNIR